MKRDREFTHAIPDRVQATPNIGEPELGDPLEAALPGQSPLAGAPLGLISPIRDGRKAEADEGLLLDNSPTGRRDLQLADTAIGQPRIEADKVLGSALPRRTANWSDS